VRKALINREEFHVGNDSVPGLRDRER
jgi:hypothetical protein